MKIALLFGIFPPTNYASIIQKSKGVVQYAADALQKSLIEGLGTLYPNDINIINLPFIGSYPSRYSEIYSPSGRFNVTTHQGNTIKGENIRFCNLKAYKLYSRYRSAYKALKKWNYTTDDSEKIIIIYSIHTPFLKAAVEIKKYINHDIKIILIVPDLPEYMGGKNSFLHNKIREYNIQIQNELYKEVDAYVLLSKYMTERLPIDHKPFTIVEGIFNNFSDQTHSQKESSTKVIFYSGTLAKRYGIMTLVEAVHAIPDTNIKLIICGDGDSKQEILNFSNKDHRIIYKGQLPRHEVLKLQKQATLLVNPRTPEGEFTKYSFPSKTMEYLASGIPTLLYKLPGIPEEYFQYCFTVTELGSKSLSSKIIEILSWNSKDLELIGKKAQTFIFEKKNPIEQSKKIVSLINKIK